MPRFTRLISRDEDHDEHLSFHAAVDIFCLLISTGVCAFILAALCAWP